MWVRPRARFCIFFLFAAYLCKRVSRRVTYYTDEREKSGSTTTWGARPARGASCHRMFSTTIFSFLILYYSLLRRAFLLSGMTFVCLRATFHAWNKYRAIHKDSTRNVKTGWVLWLLAKAVRNPRLFISQRRSQGDLRGLTNVLSRCSCRTVDMVAIFLDSRRLKRESLGLTKSALLCSAESPCEKVSKSASPSIELG